MNKNLIINNKHQWLGFIPKNWEVKPLNSITQTISVKNHPDKEILSLYRDYGVIIKSSRSDNHNKAGSDLSKYKLVSVGDLVINKMKAWQGSVGISKYQGIISPAYIICKVDSSINSSYLNYLLRCNFYKHQYGRLSYGVRTDQWDIRYDDFKKLPVLIPQIAVQNDIVNFLDFKLEKVVRFIKKKKQLIELLIEQKEAIINQAVTKGINPKAKLKSTDIEWLGDVPEYWEVTRIKFLGSAIIGLTYSPSEMVDKGEGTLVLRSSNVQNGKLTYDDCVYVTTPIPEKKRTRKGDILICSRNGSIKLIGKNALIDEKASNESFGAFMTIFRSKNYEYLHYFFNSSSFKAQSGLFSTSTINQLTTGILNNIIISIPKTIDEQMEVVQFIKNETAVIDKTISTIEKEIDLVVEYKTALIAEAVTGKIDVRGFKVPEIEEPLAMVAEEASNYNKAD